MLQDLDSLAARIGQMVQFTRQLQTERSALQAQLKVLDQEQDSLRRQLQLREHDYSLVEKKLSEHESQIQSQQSEAQSQLLALQKNLEHYKTQSETLSQQLQISQADVKRLRLVTDQARENIDSILVRLPGAAQE